MSLSNPLPEEEEEFSPQELKDAARAASETPIWLPRNSERAHQRRWKRDLKRVYDERILFWSCMADELDFTRYGKLVDIPEREKSESDFYIYKDNGSKVLAIAHLDSVEDRKRFCRFHTDPHRGPVVHSPTLDDRLGAYVITDLLPRAGINTDILLTVGEESGESTAEFFRTSKQYNWMFQFDRTGADVVMYQYDTPSRRELLRTVHAWPANGAFSDISFMDHLKCAGFNWGVGYHNYHGPQAWASLNEMFQQTARFARFYERYKDIYMLHEGHRWDRWKKLDMSAWGEWVQMGPGRSEWVAKSPVGEPTKHIVPIKTEGRFERLVKHLKRGNPRKPKQDSDEWDNRCPICDAVCLWDGCDACGWPHEVDQAADRTDHTYGMTEAEWQHYQQLAMLQDN